MTAPSAPALPAKGPVVPILRPLVSILRTSRECARRAPADPSPALERDLARHLEHLALTIQRLAEMARVRDGDLPKLIDRIRSVAARGTDPDDPQRLNRILEDVAAACRRHHDAFRPVATAQKSAFLLAYWEHVERRCVLLLHGKDAEEPAEAVARSLMDSCYFHVESLRLDHREPPLPHHIRALHATDPEELRRAVPAWQPDVVLCDIGSPRRGYDQRLGRQVTRLDRSRVSVLFRPFSAARLLGCFEEARLRHLMEARVELEPRETMRTPA